MSRSTHRDNSASVSLFPFLAVLLCTMGGLVVLLVVMSHVSRQMAERAKQVAEERAAATQPDERALDKLAKAKAYIKEVRERSAKAAKRLKQEQLRLAQVEQHVCKLQEQMALTLVEAQELASDQSEHYDDRAQAERELERLKQLVADLTKEIERLKDEQQGASRSFAIVPYKGNSGTHRRPIYIECRVDRVVLQPEGVTLTLDDFRKPLGVGNPLAAALRAAREHMVRDNPAAGIDPDAEPYPLILIRPGGILVYYQVRDAIESWESDFGYEMVDGDWDLQFPAPDPQLATVENRAIENARLRREALAQAAPSMFGGSGRSFSPEGGRGGTGDGFGSGPYDPTELAGGGDAYGSDGQATTGASSGLGGLPNVDLTGLPDLSMGEEIGGPSGAGDHSQSEADGQPGNSSIARTNGASRRAQGNLFAGKASGTQRSGSNAPGGSQSAAGSGGAMGSGASASSGLGSNGGGEQGSVASLNDKEGPDDVAIRRGVTVAVYADRLLVGKQAESVAMPGTTIDHADQFVVAVRRQIESWGLAGQGLYWRPVIKLEVRQGGQRRAAEIEALLRYSGVDVETAQTAARPAAGGKHATR